MKNVAIYFDEKIRIRITEKDARDFWEIFLWKLNKENKIYCCNKWFEIKQIVEDKKTNSAIIIISGESLEKNGFSNKGDASIPLKFDELAHTIYLWADFFTYKKTEDDEELYELKIDSLKEDDLYSQIIYEYLKNSLREYYV